MPSPLSESAACEAVQAVYRTLENRPVERSCIGRADCCRFRLTGQTPFVTRGEAWLVARAWRATGRRRLSEPSDGSCPFLSKEGRCGIYEARPFACRTHFCRAAGGPFSRRSVQDLVWELERIDHATGGEGARPIAAAVQDVWGR